MIFNMVHLDIELLVYVVVEVYHLDRLLLTSSFRHNKKCFLFNPFVRDLQDASASMDCLINSFVAVELH